MLCMDQTVLKALHVKLLIFSKRLKSAHAK
jgi:hypothetical protein